MHIKILKFKKIVVLNIIILLLVVFARNSIYSKENVAGFHPVVYVGGAYGLESPFTFLLGCKINGGLQYGNNNLGFYLDGGGSVTALLSQVGLHLEAGIRIYNITFDYSYSRWKILEKDLIGATQNISIGFMILDKRKHAIWIRIGKNLDADINVPYKDLSNAFQNMVDFGWNIEIRIGFFPVF